MNLTSSALSMTFNLPSPDLPRSSLFQRPIPGPLFSAFPCSFFPAYPCSFNLARNTMFGYFNSYWRNIKHLPPAIP